MDEGPYPYVCSDFFIFNYLGELPRPKPLLGHGYSMYTHMLTYTKRGTDKSLWTKAPRTKARPKKARPKKAPPKKAPWIKAPKDKSPKG